MFRNACLSTVLMMAAIGCGQTSSSSGTAGSSVNNGTGPLGELLVCGKEGMKFKVRTTAAVGLYQGLLEKDGEAHSLVCKRDQGASDSNPDAQQNLWSCSETRRDYGYVVKIHTQGISSIILADVSLKQMFPLEAKPIGTVICKKP